MKPPLSRAARLALDAYPAAGAPRGERFHVSFRWWSCPFPSVERAVPLDGRVLEIGCGHGVLSLYLALCSPRRRVVGVDIDRDKLDLARRAAAALADLVAPDPAPSVTFEHADGGRVPAGPWDAIVIADVLYLLDVDTRHALLDAAVSTLAPGGSLVLKETDRRPRWKRTFTVAQELLATQVLRITEGDTVDFERPEEVVARLRARGLEVVARRIDQGYLHPHHLVVGRRPAPDRTGRPRFDGPDTTVQT